MVSDQFPGFYLLAAILWIFAFMEWLAKAMHYPRMPGTYAVAGGCSHALAIWQFRVLRRRAKSLKLGRDGEREVAEVLDWLKQDGAQVIHDLPTSKSNIDHVVISTRGIYVMETKNWKQSTDRRSNSTAAILPMYRRTKLPGCALPSRPKAAGFSRA